jgi:hypothetical protein
MSSKPEQWVLPGTTSVPVSDPETMLNLVTRTLKGEQGRKMFGSVWKDEDLIEVYCHSGAALLLQVENDKVTQMSFTDRLYGSICLDEGETWEILRSTGYSGGVEDFIITRESESRDGNKKSNKSKKREAEEDRLSQYRARNSHP